LITPKLALAARGQCSKGDHCSNRGAVTLHQLAIDAAARYPERLAVAGAAGVMSYADLDHKANALAARMRTSGVACGTYRHDYHQPAGGEVGRESRCPKTS